MIDDAKASGEISEALPTPLVARIAFCLQAAISDKHRSPEVVMTDAELDEAIEQTISVFLHGVCPSSRSETPESQSSQT